MIDVDKSLWIAVLRDDAEGIARAADEGASLDRRAGEIQLSATMRTVQLAKERGRPLRDYLIRSFGEPPRTSDDYTEDAWTPLMAALHYGLRESVRALLAVGADPNSAADSGLTPLLIAVRKGDLPSAEALLDAGADPNRAMPANAPYAYGHSPLVRAAGDGNLSLVQLLLERGAEIDGRDGAGRTALLAACARPSGNVLFWKEMREDHGLTDGSSGNFLPENLWRSENQEPINEKRPLLDFFGKNPISDEEWLSIVLLLLEREADVEAETPPSREGASFPMEVSGTPLLQAACRGSLATVNLLLDAGVTPRPAAGSTPLHAAISWGDDLAVVQRLLEAGASVAERDAEGISPSGIAVRQGNIEALISLEAAGADLLATKSELGATLLHFAASHGQTEMVRFLLDYGFQIEATCALKSPAEREADRQKLRELSASVLPGALPAPEAVPSSVRPTGVTPLMLAAAANKPETVMLLLERGADPKARDSEGKSARQYARRSEETEARKREILATRAPSVETPEIADMIAKMPTTESSETLKKQLEDMAQGFSAMMNHHFDQGRAAREATLALLPE